MSNPYSSPYGQAMPPDVRSQVQWPATALMIVSIFAIFCGVLALVFDLFLLLSGAVERMQAANQGPVSEYTELTVRSIWGAVLVCTSSFILYGAIKMRNQKSYGVARAAAVLAMVPLLGPCCIFGIPFGIWAIVVLLKPEVRESFTS